jgi:hypothetical protein
LWTLAMPGEPEIDFTLLSCKRQQITVGAVNSGEKTGFLREVQFAVIRTPKRPNIYRDNRTLVADEFKAIKPNDAVVIKFSPSAEGSEELPVWQGSEICQYQLTFSSTKRARCDCPR